LLFWASIAVLSAIAPRLPENWLVSVACFNMADAAPAGVLSSSPKTKPVRADITHAGSDGKIRKGVYAGKFRVTFYWMVEEDQYAGSANAPLYTADGKEIGRFTPQFVKDFRVESCALLRNGTIISYLKQADRCSVVESPIGANGFSLTALKSIAVDPSIIPVGSTLYIPQAEAVMVNDGKMHDGVFRAHDIGGAIKGNRIDVYVGVKSNMSYFSSTSLCRPGYVDVYLLQ
jgi:3D (Asp-Asp-Asp) domain-containing protein